MKLRPILAAIVILTAAACNRKSGDPVFDATVQPFLEEHCMGCHDERAKGGLNLETVMDLSAAKSQTEVWSKVLNKISTGQMPPSGMPRPPQEDVKAVAAWIRSSIPGIPEAALPIATAHR